MVVIGVLNSANNKIKSTEKKPGSLTASQLSTFDRRINANNWQDISNEVVYSYDIYLRALIANVSTFYKYFCLSPQRALE